MKSCNKLLPIGILLCMLTYQSLAQFTQRDWDRANYRNWLAYKKNRDEGGNLLKWWRGEGTYGIAIAGATTLSARNSYDSTGHLFGPPSFDTTVKSKVIPLLSFHVNGNSNYMLMRLDASSILSLSAGMQVDFLRWKCEPVDVSGTRDPTSKLYYGHFGLPVTIDYKWGCDVDFLPEMKTCFAVGAGAMPKAGITFDNEFHTAGSFSVLPYAYVSFGVYTGFFGCVKLRATYMPAQIDMYKNLNQSDGITNTTLNAQTNNVLTMGIAIMHYSKDWSKGWAQRGTHAVGRHRYHRRSGGMIRM